MIHEHYGLTDVRFRIPEIVRNFIIALHEHGERRIPVEQHRPATGKIFDTKSSLVCDASGGWSRNRNDWLVPVRPGDGSDHRSPSLTHVDLPVRLNFSTENP
jgi:hypothetical protein